MRTSILTCLALPLVATLGCKTAYASSRGQTQAEVPRRATAHAEARCPLDVPGSSVSASDTNDGAALTFTAPPDELTGLRVQVAQWAERIERGGAAGAMGTGSGAPVDGTLSTQGEAWSGSGNESGGLGDARSPDQGPGGVGRAGNPARADEFPPARAVVQDTAEGARLVLTPNDSADAEHLRAATRSQASALQASGCASPRP
jgi:hypothetical protein